MFQTISNFMRVRDIRNKIIFTLLMLIVFRIGTFVPVPYVDADVLKQTDQMGLIGFLNTFGGGALANFSILAMGIMPYITASIIVQLLQMDVVPKFTEWAKQGEVGRRKLAQFTRYFTIVLAFVQAIAMSYGFNRMYSGSLIKDDGILTYLVIALVLTAGTAFLMWLGEQITAKGVGNGISIIIFAGIAAAIPNAVNQVYAQQIEGAGDALFINIVIIILLLLAIIAVTVGVIYVQQALRKIPIQYANRPAAASFRGRSDSNIPIKLNSASVIPVIFASTLMSIPAIVIQVLNLDPHHGVGYWLNQIFTTTSVAENGNVTINAIGFALYILLIVIFSFFYSFLQLSPDKMSENLQKQNAYVPGVRPGEAMALQFNDLKNGTLTINKTIDSRRKREIGVYKWKYL